MNPAFSQTVEKPLAGFSDKLLQSAACIICPQWGTDSTLAAREVFSARYTPRQKTDWILFAANGGKLCEAFLTGSEMPG